MDKISSTDPTCEASPLHSDVAPVDPGNPTDKEKIDNLEAASQNNHQDVRAMPAAKIDEPTIGAVAEAQQTSKTENGAQDRIAGVSNHKQPPHGTLDDRTTASKGDDHADISAPKTIQPVDSTVENQPPGNISEDSLSSDSSSYAEDEEDDDPEEVKSDDEVLLNAASSMDNKANNIQNLLDKGANPLATDFWGRTALHLAILGGNKESALVLLKTWKSKNFDINIKDNFGMTPMHEVISRDISHPEDIVNELLTFPDIDLAVGDDDGWTPLYYACFRGKLNIAKSILKKEMGLKTLEIREKHKKLTPLQVACSELELGVVNLLLSAEYKAKTDVVDISGQTPLHLVVQSLRDNQSNGLSKNGLEIIKALTHANSSVDVVDLDGHTALQYAGRGPKDVDAADTNQKKIFAEAVKNISAALTLERRKEIFLEIYANEDDLVRDRLLKNLEWGGFQQPEIELIKHEAKLIRIAVPSPGKMEADILKTSQTKLLEELNSHYKVISPLGPRPKNKPRSDLALASCFGYYRLAYVLLLYSNSEWKAIKENRDEALTVAKDMASKVGKELRKMKSSETDSAFIAEKHRRKKDFKEVVDILNDPPTGDYDLVRGPRLEIDDLSLKPIPNDKGKLSKTIDATIVDFHKIDDPEGRERMDFLRRTRSVWDVVYAEPESHKPSEAGLKSKAGPQVEEINLKAGDKGCRDLEKKKARTGSRLAPTTKSSELFTNCGPVNIMKAARKKTNQARAGKTGGLCTERNFQFRWLHLSANNVSGHKHVTILTYSN